jgi:ATP-binding protein involved in chromosome partitioning
MEVPFLGTVPLDPAIVESGDAGVPTVLAEPQSAAAEAFRQIARSVVAQVAGEDPTASEPPGWLGKLRGELGG